MSPEKNEKNEKNEKDEKSPQSNPPSSPVSDTTPWPELLDRFARAAFFVYEKLYTDPDFEPETDVHVRSPQDILLPPLSAETIAAKEKELGGWLPDDLKEMALVADGFYGGCCISDGFMCGGWGGIETLSAEAAADMATWFAAYDPDDYELLDGQVCLDGYPGTRDDENKFIIIPPEVWRRTWDRAEYIDPGYEYEEGDYALGVYQMHLGNGQIEVSGKACFRKWVQDETEWLEQSWAAGEQEEAWRRECDGEYRDGEDDDEDGNEMDE
jgi:hypothetical protein